MKRAVLLAAGCLLAAASAWAIQSNPQCVADAAAEKIACKDTCQENFIVAKDMCRNVDHACADACRADRDLCVAPIYAALQTCIDGCNAVLDQTKADCLAQYGPSGTTPDPVLLNQCIDAGQVVAFVCRDTCRENLDRAGLKQCRTVFRDCIGLCPPAN